MRPLSMLFAECLAAKYTHVDDVSFALLRQGAACKLLFEDSNGKRDWQRNLRFPAMPYYGTEPGYMLHGGFLSAWRAVKPYIDEVIFDPRVRMVTVAGYSHGAALATICYDYVWYHRPDVRAVMEGAAFAPPRVIYAPKGLPEPLRSRFAGLFTVCNAGDVVTMMPPSRWGYVHVGTRVDLGQKGRYGIFEAHLAKNYERELLLAGL